MIRLTVPSIDEADVEAVSDVLRSGFLVQGRKVAEFERAVATYLGSSHAIAVANGTAALHLSLLSMGVGPGDRVAVAAYSWPATANVIELCAAIPVFVDVEPRSGNLSPTALQRALRQAAVKLILPVHTFGSSADMTAILGLAGEAGVPVLEDAACAFGTSLNGRMAGTFGRLGCFSFHPRKAITTGEGGMVVTDDATLAEQVRVLRNHGQDPSAKSQNFVAAGFNLRLTEFQAALGLSQLEKLDRILNARQQAAERYDALLTGTGIEPLDRLAGSRHVHQSYVVLLPELHAGKRAALIEELRRRGIEATIGTHHLPLISYFRAKYGFQPGDFPGTDSIAARALSLPMYETLTESEQETVVRNLVGCLSAGGAACA